MDTKGPRYTYFDLANPFVEVPKNIFAEFILALKINSLSTPIISTVNGVLNVACDILDTLPEIHFLIQDRWIVLMPEDYLFDTLGDQTSCIFLVKQN